MGTRLYLFTNLDKIKLTASTEMQIGYWLAENWGRRRVEYCVESSEGMRREKRECGTATEPLLHIYCYMRNQRLGATKHG
jgi:hypothetical protein